MLVSVHLPKTGGSSFLASIKGFYGQSLLRDNGDKPINTPPLKRKAAAITHCIKNTSRDFEAVHCMHGHFMPLKYMFLLRRADVQFVTWLRDPLERLASHYFYWLKNYDPQTAGALRRRVVEEGWSLERFCLAPELRNFYSQFLWGFPVRRFDFVGITEYYDADFAYFSNKYLGTELPVKSRNINENKPVGSYFEDGALRCKLESYHSKDIALYQKACAVRLKSRC